VLRGEAADLLLAGVVAIAMGDEPIDRCVDSLYHTVVGADGLSGLLRGALSGKAFPETFFDPPHVPKDLLDLMHDIDRRTCGIAIEEAASRWGQAASSVNLGSSALTTRITGLSPSTGCAGTVVTISGTGFPSPAPTDLQVLFPRHGGGCAPASSVQWQSSTTIQARIAVTHDGEELAGIEVPPEPPALEPPRVDRGESGLVVQWAASHPEDRELSYIVRYAADEESLWRFVTADLTESRLELAAGTLPGSERGRIQVGASAGGRTTWAESEPFGVEPSVPEPVVLAPASGAEVTAGQESSFRGEAMTLEHGLLAGEALSWRSHLDGELGSGSHLRAYLTTPGEHVIELTVRSPAGPEAVASTRVYVTERPGGAAG
jgi:hypothetical protein